MKYKIDEKEYDVLIERKNNKNTYIRIKDDLTIHITTNYLMTNYSIKKILDDNKEYLLNNINKKLEKQKNIDLFYYLGKVYDIIIYDNKDIEIFDNRIYVKSKDYLDKWLKKQIKKIFQEQLDIVYNEFEEDIPYPNLRIRKMTTRWGVCNKKTNTVTLNSELIHYDISKLKYVIIHELAHFIHFNHSKNFWELVNKYCPDYKNIRKQMRE